MSKNDSHSSTDQTDVAPRIVSIRLDRVQIGEKRRTVADEAVNDLAVSMRDIGLINPINVARIGKDDEGKVTYLLVGGLHRLKAAKLLGWQKINATILKGDDDELRLCEIAENLFRNNPSALESAELITEYADIVGRKAVQLAHPGGQQPNDKGISQAARELHITREKVRRAKAIATLTPVAKEAARTAKLSNNRSVLLKAAEKTTPDEQVQVIADVAVRKATQKAERKKPRPQKLPQVSSPPTASEEDLLDEAEVVHRRDADFEYLKDAWAKVPDFVEAWNNASLPAREMFIKEVLLSPPTTSSANTEEANDDE